MASALALARQVEGTPRVTDEDGSSALPPAFSALKPLGARVHPITADEFRERLLHAQKLMVELTPNVSASFSGSGSSGPRQGGDRSTQQLSIGGGRCE